MALPPEVGDREVQKFVETDAGEVAVRVQDAAGNALDSGNSSQVELGVNQQFKGTWLDVSSYPAVQVSLSTDHQGTLYMEWTSDNTQTGDFDAEFKIEVDNPGNTEFVIRRNHRAQYYRTRYLNDGFAQTGMKLNTFHGEFNAPHDGVRLRGNGFNGEFVDVRTSSRQTSLATSDMEARILLENICDELKKQTALLEQIAE
jgi:hypothetical protein